VKILGIETSCDETAAGVVEDGHILLSNEVASSMELHAKYGGIVPEIAARSHIEVMMPVITEALDKAQAEWSDIDGIAVTYGAGLGGSLLIGVITARTLAVALNKPLYAVNHVVGHVYANFITESELKDYEVPTEAPKFPMLALIVSGKHSQIALFKNHFDYVLFGQTQDDAVGEAYDKVAKMLGLGYPGGPAISALAKKGNSDRFKFPIAKVGKYDFSFSGLKTAVLRQAQELAGGDFTFPSIKLPEALSDAQKADIAASFEQIAIKTLVDKLVQAYREYSPKSVVIAGGVAANGELRKQISEALGQDISFPDFKLCTDNGAMIAALGGYMRLYNQPTADPLTLAIEPNLSM
jgi:N6-L-threonylcarbamoyladenine synthase